MARLSAKACETAKPQACALGQIEHDRRLEYIQEVALKSFEVFEIDQLQRGSP
jgi:hypothetical protein